MSCTVRIHGALDFATSAALELALDRLVARGALWFVPLHRIGRRADTLTFDLELDGPASGWSPALVALGELADAASGGELEVDFDGLERSWLAPPGGVAPRDDGAVRRRARHHRWDLYFALLARDRAEVERAIRSGAAIDAPLDHEGRRALHLATASGREDLVALLLAAGADPAATDARGAPAAPLHVRREERRDRFWRPEPDATYLHHELVDACGANRPEIALARLTGPGALLAPDADLASGVLVHGLVEVWDAVRARGGDWRSAFREHEHAAAPVDDDFPWPATIWSSAIWSSAIWSAQLGQGGSIELFGRVAGLGVPIDLRAAIAAAAEHGRAELLSWLLDRPGALAACGRSSSIDDPMVRAAIRGRVEMMLILERAGVPVQPDAPFQTSPIHAAAARIEGLDAVAWLLDRGVPGDAVDRHGTTPFGRGRWLSHGHAAALAALGLE